MPLKKLRLLGLPRRRPRLLKLLGLLLKRRLLESLLKKLLPLKLPDSLPRLPKLKKNQSLRKRRKEAYQRPRKLN